MKLIYTQSTKSAGEIINFQNRAEYFGPNLVATCDDFNVEETLTELGDKLDTTELSFLVVSADEYITDSRVTEIT